MKCPDCGSSDIVIERYEFAAKDTGRCHNCGYRGEIEDFSMEESMDEVQITPTEEVRALLANIQQHEQQKVELIASLQQQRQQIDQALIDLGAKRRRRKAESKKRGRPAGSKNKVATIGGEAA